MPTQPAPRKKLRVLSFLMIIAIGGAAAYYFSFYSQKREYITDRNFRRLGVISDQIEARMDGLHNILENAVENINFNWQRCDSLDSSLELIEADIERLRRAEAETLADKKKVSQVIDESIQTIKTSRARTDIKLEGVRRQETSEQISQQVLKLKQSSYDNTRTAHQADVDKARMDELQNAFRKAQAALEYINFRERLAAAIGIVPFAALEYADTITTAGRDTSRLKQNFSSRIENVELIRQHLFLTYRNIAASGPDLIIRVRVNLEDMITQQISNVVFDNVFLAKSGGAVIYQHNKHRGNVRTLDKVHALNKEEKSLDFSHLLKSGGLVTTEFSGEEQILFARPLDMEIGARDSTNFNWVLVGAVPANKLLNESLALPTNTILVFVFVAALLILLWPLLNILGAGTFTRLRKTDLAFLGLSAMLGSALIALLIVDQYQLTNLRKTMDDQLKETAREAHENFHTELRQAYSQLRFLADSLRPHLNRSYNEWEDNPLTIVTRRPIDAHRTERLSLEGQLPRTHNMFNFVRGDTSDTARPAGWHYLNFDRVFFADRAGDIKVKLAAKSAATPFLNVSSRDYFRDVQRNNMLQLHEGDHDHRGHDHAHDDGINEGDTIEFALSQHHSWASGTYETTMAIPVNPDTVRSASWLAGMDIGTLATFDNPLLPPTFNFVLVDEQGNVLYHTRPERSGFENFLTECDNNQRLAATLAGRRSDWLSSTYWGENRRMYTLPLHDTPWTLIAYFSEEALLDGSNIVMLTSTLGLYGVNLLLLLVLVVLGFSSSSVQLDWLWPSLLEYRTYRNLSLIYLGFLIFYAVTLTQDVRFDHVMVAALLLPVFFVFITYFSLKRQEKFNFRIALIILPFAGFYPLAAAVQLYNTEMDLSPAWRLALPVLLVTALPAAIVGWRKLIKRFRRIKRGWRRELLFNVVTYHLVILLMQTVFLLWDNWIEFTYHLILIAMTAYALHQFQSKRNYVARDQYLHELYRHRAGQVTGVPSARLFRRTYRAFLIILTMTTGILPIIAYFILANEATFNLLIKHSQISMAQMVFEREHAAADRVAQLTTSEAEYLYNRFKHDERGMYNGPFFDSELLCSATSAGKSDTLCFAECRDTVVMHDPAKDPIGSILPRLLSRLSLSAQNSVDLRRYLGTKAADSVWKTGATLDGRKAAMVHKRLNSPHDVLLLSSGDVPQIKPGGFRFEETSIFMGLFIASMACIIVLYWASYKFGEQVLLTRFANPRSGRSTHIDIPADAPLFIISRPLTAVEEIIENSSFDTVDPDWKNRVIFLGRAELLELTQEKIESMAETGAPLCTIEAFDLDPEYSQANIAFMLRVNALKAAADWRVIVIGSVDPTIAFQDQSVTATGHAKPVEQNAEDQAVSDIGPKENLAAARAYSTWQTAFYQEMHDSQMYRADLELISDEFNLNAEHVQHCIRILAHEFHMTRWLRQRGRNLMGRICRDYMGFDEAALRRQIMLEAEPLYQAIWNSCSRGEKVLLANLARDGIVNGKNKRGVYSLLNKQLMMLVPDPKLINDSFREYLQRDDIQQEADALSEKSSRTSWENLRTPLIVLLAAGGAFLIVTQHEIIDMSTAIVSAVTVLVPGIMKALDFFRNGRLAGGA